MMPFSMMHGEKISSKRRNYILELEEKQRVRRKEANCKQKERLCQKGRQWKLSQWLLKGQEKLPLRRKLKRPNWVKIM